jgi:23S rRNA (guanine745-N1)-methyltransferase
MWICPVCRWPLSLTEKQWQCENGHSYDCAKAGYVNLLLANHKNVSDPGDSKPMMTARRAFLEAGHYLPLVESLTHLIASHKSEKALALYDVGCGEGYYLAAINAALTSSGVKMKAAGNDISKSAIEKAAKKYKELGFVIASNFKIPVASASQNVTLQIFAPVEASEVRRILADSGIWLQVAPAQEHLTQLRQAVYETAHDHVVDEKIPEGFKLIDSKRLSFQFELPELQSRRDLLMMTPYYWSMEQAKADDVLENITKLSADFSIRVLEKKSLV